MTAVGDFKAAQERLLRHFGVAAESRFFNVRAVDGPVHVLTAGEGPALVMIPGFADPAAMWSPLMARLRDFRLFAVDRPCFGLSGKAALQTRTFRTLAVDFIEQVLDALDLERPLIVGNSMGSLWSTWFALERPHRVSALIHIGCPALILGTSAPLPMRLISVPGIGRLLMKLSPPSRKQVVSFARIAGEDLSNMPEMCDLLVAAQKLPGADTAIRELLQAVVRLRGARRDIALTREQIGALQHAVLLVWGDRDPFGGVDVAEEVVRAIPEATLRVIEGSGHIPWFAHPEEVGQAVRTFSAAVRR